MHYIKSVTLHNKNQVSKATQHHGSYLDSFIALFKSRIFCLQLVGRRLMTATNASQLAQLRVKVRFKTHTTIVN
jgi:hypothetical protein